LVRGLTVVTRNVDDFERLRRSLDQSVHLALSHKSAAGVPQNWYWATPPRNLFEPLCRLHSG
jgi:hypothetical protein